MLPAKYRLQKFSNLKTVRRSQNQKFELILKAGGKPKLGVVVSKKVAKKAVDRNRIKRMIHEALKEKIVNLGSPLIIILKANLASQKMPEIKKDLETLLKKLK